MSFFSGIVYGLRIISLFWRILGVLISFPAMSFKQRE
jgi:hypothetical protein